MFAVRIIYLVHTWCIYSTYIICKVMLQETIETSFRFNLSILFKLNKCAHAILCCKGRINFRSKQKKCLPTGILQKGGRERLVQTASTSSLAIIIIIIAIILFACSETKKGVYERHTNATRKFRTEKYFHHRLYTVNKKICAK